MSLPVALLGVAGLLMLPKLLAEKIIRKRRADRELKPPVFKGKMNIPRKVAVFRFMRSPMTEDDDENEDGDVTMLVK